MYGPEPGAKMNQFENHLSRLQIALSASLFFAFSQLEAGEVFRFLPS